MSPALACPALPAVSLMALLQGLAHRRGGAMALDHLDPGSGERSAMTFAELLGAAQTLAAAMAARGVGPGDRVAWLGHNHPKQIALLFGLARLGAVLVPLNHRLAQAELAAVLADCAPRCLVHSAGFAQAARALCPLADGPLCVAVDALAQAVPLAHAIESQALDRPALLVYTSGTTGAPKAAVHTQGHLLANMAIAALAQNMRADDTVLTVLPLFHVGGLCIQTLPALSVGATVLLHARFEASATLQAIAQDRPSLTLQVPATLQALTGHPQWADTDLSSLRAVWAGSSLLPPAPLQAFMARGVPVGNVYGSTETGPFSIALAPSHSASHLGSCGWPAPGVEVQLLGPQGQVVAPGQVGEVCVRAANVVTHYWPENPACDADGFFHSGDLAQQALDGSYTVVGRAKDMVISGGENIYPAEIENLLLQHPMVIECCVVGQADARWGEVAVALLVLHGPHRLDGGWEAPIRAFLDGRLARYKWPRRWLRVDALPKTALGKVHKAALKALLDAPAAQ